MRFALALALLLVSSEVGNGLVSRKVNIPVGTGRLLPRLLSARSISASAVPEFAPDESQGSWQNEQVEDVDLEQEQVDLRRQRFQQRKAAGRFQVELPLIDNAVGLTLIQIETGRKISKHELDLASMDIAAVSSGQDSATDSIQRLDPSSTLEQLDYAFRGVLVHSVTKGSTAWLQGVRPGDVLVSVSATLGDMMWPKSTLEGVKSAIASRKVVSGSVALEFERLSERVDNLFELTLIKPLGFQIQESQDGYVEVSAINENAPNLVRYALQVGDRVVAVDSSLGDKLWPVSTVEGVISACTSRLPGQTVTLRFERPPANMKAASETMAADETISRAQSASNAPVAPKETVKISLEPTVDRKQLVSRCRDVLRRYSAEKMGKLPSKLGEVPSLVADKVVDALASASVTMDSVTLSMLMNAYLSCRQPDKAIRLFEASVGFGGDGSLTPVTTVIEGKNGNGSILPSESALNLYTGTALMQAHTMRGDMGSVCRVLAALEGRSGTIIDGREVAPWPWTGVYGSIQPDTKCYNIALAAAEKIGGPESLLLALEVFGKMRDPKSKETSLDRRPEQDVVSFNTLVSALSNAGRSDDAFRLFDQMNRVGVRPDKYTYTSLIKACSHEGDSEELVYDMWERGISGDVVTYNTVIRSLCEKRHWSQAMKLITEMESRGISPDSRTYSFLMNAMLKGGKPSACLTLFESACVNERTQTMMQNVHIYTTAITAASVLGDYDRALELLSRMKANGVKPNVKTLTAVVGACLAARNYDLAAEVYRLIEKPDGYAMFQGVQALCGNGDLNAAASMLQTQRRGQRMLSGKQMMSSYRTVLHGALKARDYALAREVLSDLLKKGYIPNKAIFESIIDAFDINVSSVVNLDDNDRLRFRFLLFVIDSLRKRNLPIDGSLYASTLVSGRQIGGMERRVAILLARAKTNAGSAAKELLSSSDSAPEVSVESWENLLTRNDSRVTDSLAGDSLPALPVRVSSRDMQRVFRAEQSVAYTRKPRK